MGKIPAEYDRIYMKATVLEQCALKFESVDEILKRDIELSGSYLDRLIEQSFTVVLWRYAGTINQRVFHLTIIELWVN